MSGAPSAPTISWVLWPPGANLGGLILSRLPGLAASTPSRTCPIAFLMTATSFWGASRARASSRGSSILADSRSAYSPAISTSFASASGISFRWI